MDNNHLELAKKMFKFAGLKHHDIEPSAKNSKIYFINFKDEHKYELWEMSGIWSVSTVDKELVKKHEEFYFALKHLILMLVSKEMDHEFNMLEDNLD